MRASRRLLSDPSATKNPTTSAIESAAAVSSRAVSAPLQYGWEENADQNRCQSKLASTSLRLPYETSEPGILYFAASFASVPFPFSFATPALICAPIESPLR